MPDAQVLGMQYLSLAMCLYSCHVLFAVTLLVTLHYVVTGLSIQA